MAVKFSTAARQLINAATALSEERGASRPRVRDLSDALSADGVELPPIPISTLNDDLEPLLAAAAALSGGDPIDVAHFTAALSGLRATAPLTAPEAAFRPAHVRPPSTPRTGIGYDSHRFAPGGPMILGGLALESDVHLAGHSDGDAICHALTDAILGAANAGDIGALFPDTAAENKGRDSIDMLQRAHTLVRGRGWAVAYLDVTVIAERPKIGPHRAAMCARIAAAIGIAQDDISIKGKTNEGMGWVGRGEGLAVMAVATLVPAAV